MIACLPVPANGLGPMPDTLEERFRELAQKRLAEEDVPLHDRIEARFLTLLQSGVARMRSGGVADDPEQLVVAEKSLMRLVDGMIRETRERELAAVNRSVYDFALGRYCPAWPFC